MAKRAAPPGEPGAPGPAAPADSGSSLHDFVSGGGGAACAGWAALGGWRARGLRRDVTTLITERPRALGPAPDR
jgi:hypothetical protein